MPQYCTLVSALVVAVSGRKCYTGSWFESVVHQGEEGTVGRGVLMELFLSMVRWLVRWLATVSSACWLLSVNMTQT